MRALALAVWLASLAAVPPCLAENPTPQPQDSQAQDSNAQNAEHAPSLPLDEQCARVSDLETPEGAIALLGSRWIFATEIEEHTLPALWKLEDTLAQARARQLTMMISATLLTQAAEATGVSDVELLRRELQARVSEPTEEDLRTAYATLSGRDLPPFEALRSHLRRQLISMRQAEASRLYAEELRARGSVTAIDETVLLAPPDWPDEEMLATVGGAIITAGDLRAAFQPVLTEALERRYEIQIEGLEVVVNSILLAEEAARRGIDTRTLLEEEAAPLIPVVSDRQVLRYHERNRGQFDLDLDIRSPEGRQIVRAEIERQLRVRAEIDVARRLRESADLRVLIPPPEEMVWALEDEGQPGLGPRGAPVVVQAFIDLECSSCAWLFSHLPEVRARFGDRVRLVVRDFPLERHPLARRGALAAEAAYAQGRFWEFVAAVHEASKEPTEAVLLGAAQSAGLDLDRFARDRESEAIATAVDRDIREGLRIGIEATPAVHVNGRRIRLEREDTLIRAIEAAFAAPEDSARR